MHRNDRFAGSGAASHEYRPVIVAIRDLTLFRMQENAPPLETFLKDAAQLRLAVRDKDGLAALLRLDQLAEGQVRWGCLRCRFRLSADPRQCLNFLVLIAGCYRVENLIC